MDGPQGDTYLPPGSARLLSGQFLTFRCLKHAVLTSFAIEEESTLVLIPTPTSDPNDPLVSRLRLFSVSLRLRQLTN